MRCSGVQGRIHVLCRVSVYLVPLIRIVYLLFDSTFITMYGPVQNAKFESKLCRLSIGFRTEYIAEVFDFERGS